jgi:hypothetical protein
VSRLNYSQILAELAICDKFLPPAVKKSSRYIYFEMIAAACEFVIEQESKMKKLENESSPQNSFDSNLQLNQSLRDDNQISP